MLINNHNIYVESYGPTDGSPIIFLHDGLGSTHSWRRQVSDFVNSGFRVILYDRWGYGKSEIRFNLGIPEFDEDRDDLDYLIGYHNFSTVSLIGHSDGGTIALYYALENPQKISTLITIAAHIYIEDKMETGIQTIGQTFLENNLFQERMLFAHGNKFRTTFDNWFDGWHSKNAKGWDMRPILAGIQCPTLIIQGEEDEHASPQHAIDIYENIPNASLWLVPGINHMVPQEIPETFNARVVEFLRSKNER